MLRQIFASRSSLSSVAARTFSSVSPSSASAAEPPFKRAESLDEFRSSLFSSGGHTNNFATGLPPPRRVGRLRPQATNILATMDATFKNCIMNGLPSCVIPCSNTTHGILRVLLKEGMIRGFRYSNDTMGFDVFLKYLNAPSQGGATVEPAMHGCQLLSRTSRLYFVGLKELKRISKVHYPSIFIIRTSKGIMSHFEALEHGYGGEVLCRFI